jgi:hypothetical protein
MMQDSSAQKRSFELKPPHLPTTKEAALEERNFVCVKYNNIDFATRLKDYPYNVACKIQFVSFVNSIDSTETQERKVNDSLPVLNDTVCYSRLNEVRTLTHAEIDLLSDIVYNYGYKGPVSFVAVSNCYIPRNAILFLDCSGKLLEFIEICFDCERMRESSEKVSLGEVCEQKFNMVKDLFRKVGIEYGVTRGMTGSE